MLKKSLLLAFLFMFLHFNMLSMRRPLTARGPRVLSRETAKVIEETPEKATQDVMHTFAIDPKNDLIKEWLRPHVFNNLSNSELLDAIAPLSVHEGVLLISLIALDDQFEDSFNNMRSKRLDAKNYARLAQHSQALNVCTQATKQLETEVKPTFEKIKAIDEYLNGAAAKVAHNIFSSLKIRHGKIMEEESKIETYKQKAKECLQNITPQPAASPSPE